MKRHGSKSKLSRALGIALTPKAGRIMMDRPYGPGQHGPNKRMRKESDYKRQLLEKQRLRAQFNVNEKQMTNYFKKASQQSGNTGDNLIQLLESRLDAIVHRGCLAPTIYAARQFVSHGHILVDGERVTIPSYRVKPGQTISVREKSREIPAIVEAVEQGRPIPNLDLAKEQMAVKVLHQTSKEDSPALCEISLVVEYYAR